MVLSELCLSCFLFHCFFFFPLSSKTERKLLVNFSLPLCVSSLAKVDILLLFIYVHLCKYYSAVKSCFFKSVVALPLSLPAWLLRATILSM